MPDVTDSLESIDRRVGRLERTLENGPYVRKDVWYEVVGSLREDLAGLRSDIGMIRKDMEDERKARENDRRGIRNLVLAAVFSAGLSVVVTFVVAGAQV